MLTVNFKVDDGLKGPFESIREEYALIRAVIITVEDEVFKLHGTPTEATANMADDLKKVRDDMNAAGLEAAFLIVKVKEGEFTLVSFCAEGVKAKVKMLYASGVGHLAEESKLNYTSKIHVLRIAEIVPSLFARESEESRAELMTEKEKMRAVVDRMELAPNPTAMPGVTMPLTDDGMQLLERFGRGEVCAVTFIVEDKNITVDKSLETAPAESDAAMAVIRAVAALIPVDHPRFVVLRCPTEKGETKAFMVYVCPSSCKPREKMPYSSTKPSFVAQATHHGVRFARRLEVDSAEELRSAVEDALCARQEIEDEAPPQPAAPKPFMSKGPRMLI